MSEHLNVRLEAIAERASRATEGPWARFETHQADNFVVGPRGFIREDIVSGPTYERSNAEFIAHARTDVPTLVAALRAVLNACNTYEKTQAIYRIEMGQREIIRVVRAEIEAALGEVAS